VNWTERVSGAEQRSRSESPVGQQWGPVAFALVSAITAGAFVAAVGTLVPAAGR
jgi:hypothetical protein